MIEWIYMQTDFMNHLNDLWVIHESKLLQMRGAGHEAVAFHCECPATKQMRQDRLARRVKDARNKIKIQT